jgi:hypothetical protein
MPTASLSGRSFHMGPRQPGGACRCHASRGHSCIRMVVGAVAMLGLSVLLAGARRTAGLGRTALRELQRGVIPSV